MLRTLLPLLALIIALVVAAPSARAADPEDAIVQAFFEEGPDRVVGSGGYLEGFYDIVDGEAEREGRLVHIHLVRPNGSTRVLPDAVVDADGDFAVTLAPGTFDVVGAWQVVVAVDAFDTWPAANYALHLAVTAAAVPPPLPPVAPVDGPAEEEEQEEEQREPNDVEPVAVTLTVAGPRVVRVARTCAAKRTGCPVFTGTFRPAAAGVRVRLVVERRVGARWKAAGSVVATTGAGGALKGAWKPAARPKLAAAKLRARWVYAGDDLRLHAMSAWFSFTVKR